MTQQIEHPEMVRVLTKPGKDILLALTSDEANLWHVVSGVATEMGELLDTITKFAFDPNSKIDLVNVIEELGDYEFFMEAVRQSCNFQREVIPDKEFHAWFPSGTNEPRTLAWCLISKAMIEASELLTLVKAAVVYRKAQQTSSFALHAGKLEYYLEVLRQLFAIDRQACLDANIAKLEKRYQNFCYSDAAGRERKDKIA